MRRIVWSIVGFSLVLSALWLLTGWSSFKGPTFFGLRDGVVQLSGVLGIGLMTVGVVLSARPRRLEGFYNGLDKMYRLHKWVGIVALVVSAFHWFMASGFKFLIQWGILAGGGGRPDGEHAGRGGEAGQTLMHRLIGPAHWTSEWAFYAMLILGAVALFTFVAYRLFALSHRLLNVIYLVIAFHSVVLFTPTYWLSPIGAVTAFMIAVGTIYSILELFHVPTHLKRVHGRIEAVEAYPELDAVHVGVALSGTWRGHEAGQFAFVKTTPFEAPHPFSIASDWRDDGKLTFVIRNLGDFTGKLRETLTVGGSVKLEGPYGRFEFSDGKKRQIWVGAGIGITPFIARLQQLQRQPTGQKITLYHPTSRANEEAFDLLRADARKAGVELTIWDGRKNGRLTAKRIIEDTPDWREASVWFCGPVSFMKATKREFLRAGLRSEDFHHELFKMR